ncbi:hypothetical protein [Blastopirellula marina]|uniref:hypothetical protein n=1 Tax=Blastopirellula marina TaxID=124 RepID=UPI001304A53F|nr:hypothetical protein [Blastopirellula marina]
MIEGLGVLAVIVVAWLAIYYIPRIFRLSVRRTHFRGQKGRPRRASFGRRRDSGDGDE